MSQAKRFTHAAPLVGGRCTLSPDAFDIYQTGTGYAAVANPVQRQILEALRAGEKQLPELVEITGRSKPTLSSLHMKELLARDLIEERAHPTDSRRKVYRLTGSRIGSSDIPVADLRDAVKRFVATDPDLARPGTLQFRYTLLYVQDVATSLAFYGKAFGVPTRFLAPGEQYGELETGTTALGFVSVQQAKGNLPQGFRIGSRKDLPGNFEVAFVTDDVHAAYDRAVQAGATPSAPPAKKPWGQVIAYVRDLDGVLVELAGKLDH